MSSAKAVFALAASVAALMVLEQVITWTDHSKGFINGLFHGVISFPFALAPATVWVVLVLGNIAKHRPSWRNWFTVFLPTFILLLLLLLLFPTPRKRFLRITNTELPSQIEDLRSIHAGGGFADDSHTYIFTTTPAVTEALLRSLELEDPIDVDWELDQPPEFPEVKTWINPVSYDRLEGRNWFFRLITDESLKKVYFQAVTF